MDEKQVRQIVKEEIAKELKPVKKDIKELKAGQKELSAGQDGMMQIIDDISKNQDVLKEQQEKIMESIDFLVGDAQRRREEELAGNYLDEQRDKKINDHEKRIEKLEAVSA